MTDKKKSVFAEHAWKFIERGISVIPIAPGTKRPGQWSPDRGWEGMSDWTRFAKRMPTELELEIWETWPDAGIGVVLGELSRLILLDKDYDIPNGGNDALQAIIPHSPIAKRGQKGWGRFYRYNGERSCSFDVGGLRVLDVLAEGRQTVVPPSMHPTGVNYTWITLDTLDSITSVDDLPTLPDGFLDQVAKVLEPYQTEADKQNHRSAIKPKDDTGKIDTTLSAHAEYYRDLNKVALARLDDWVPRIVPTAKRDKDGYRCIATWRGVTNPNVGIHPHGVRDWGGGYGMTPLDLVMYANGLPFAQAAEALRNCIQMADDPITMTVGGVPIQAGSGATAPVAAKQTTTQTVQPKPAVPVAPTRLPWQSMTEAPTVMLPPSSSTEPAQALPRFITTPPGILYDISAWISETAHKCQPELSLAGAIALAATCTQRIYRSNLGNFTSLYVVLVAKSTEGKEHPQGAVEKILTAAGLGHLVAGSGYTSAGAVFSALFKQPNHLALIDEMGKLLKMSRAKGNANSEAAIDKLVEAYGKLDGVIRPPVYSTMSLNKAQKTAMQSEDQMIYNPAITVLGATTPGTFYQNLTDDLVQDGFLGRLIVVESVLPRQLMRFDSKSPPPEKIVAWCKQVNSPPQKQGNLTDVAIGDMPACTIEMTIGPECIDLMRAFEAELNKLKDQYEPEGLDVLLGRTFEKALRLAMIAAKACDVNSLAVKVEHLEWAISYVRHYDLAMIRAVRKNRVSSQVDGEIKKAVNYIQGARKYATDPKLGQFAGILASGGMPHQLLLKKMHMKAKEFQSLMETAIESGVLVSAPGLEYNYAGLVYRLSSHDID